MRSPMPARRRAPLWAFVFVLVVADGVSRSRSSPIHKVIELLTVLKRQLTTDGQEDGARHENYTNWYVKERASAKKILSQTNQTIQGLSTDLRGQASLRESLKQKLEKTIGELSKNEKELKDAVELRASERKDFESSEANMLEGIDQLERALVVLAKGKPGAARPGGPSLLSIAKDLRVTLENTPDFTLSDSERETLNSFFSQAAVSGRGHRHGAEFLQARDGEEEAEHQPGPASVGAMLQNVLEKTKKELDDTRQKEVKSQTQFKAFEAGLKKEIENKQKTLAETKMSLSQSQEKSGQMQAKLQEAEELLKVTKAHLSKLEEDNTLKMKYFKERVAKRTDEMLAVQEASQILTSEAMNRVLGPPKGAAPKAAASFIQLKQSTSRKVLHILHAATKPGLALLALRTHINEVSGVDIGADPFAKVKRMIQDMLQRLQDEQSKEAQQASWCDSEMTKSTKALDNKQSDVQKLKDRIASMDSDLAQLKSDIAVITQDLQSMKQAVEKASKLRKEESSKAVAALTQYQDAQKLIQLAIAALQKFYNSQGAGTPQKGVPQGEAFKASGLGAGVTGILEVALEDYRDLEKETQRSETSAQATFKTMMDESDVRTAVFTKDLEYKSREKVRLEGERMRANADLASYNKELGAVSTYLDKLKAQCIGKPDTFEERKGRREAELKSLQGALQFLNGEAIA